MTYREVVGKKVLIVFGGGLTPLTCEVMNDGDELLTVKLLPKPMEKGNTALINKEQIRYVRVIDERIEDVGNA